MAELVLKNVSYRYKSGTKDVLSGITCTFSEGKLNAIIGPSGSGKTTLLSIMAGLDAPSGGSVYANGEDLSKLDLNIYRREQVTMIFQAYHLFPLLSVLENVCYPMEMVKVPKKQAIARARELLEKLGIPDSMYKRYPANISGGEQQRVAIARALASGARVLLADEPTGNLDVANAGKIMEILGGLAHNDGICVIVVTHNQTIAESSDTVLRLSDGLIVS